jgi:hypothetical protein
VKIFFVMCLGVFILLLGGVWKWQKKSSRHDRWILFFNWIKIPPKFPFVIFLTSCLAWIIQRQFFRIKNKIKFRFFYFFIYFRFCSLTWKWLIRASYILLPH